MPGSALPSRRCPPDKVRPVASSSRASSPALSMIPRAPPTSQLASPYHTQQQQQQSQQQSQQQKNSSSMLEKLKLFKNTDKQSPLIQQQTVTTKGKRTSSSSGVSSAKSERSDSSASLEPTIDLKPVRNSSRLKQTRPQKQSPAKNNSPNQNKKDILVNGQVNKMVPKIAVEVEKHAHKVANLPTTKLAEPKVRSKNETNLKTIQQQQQQQQQNNTGIPKPTAAVKGTSKPITKSKDLAASSKPAIALVSPMKNDKELSESSHSVSTGHHSNSSESSVIYKPSSESGSEQHNIIPNRKEPLTYLSEADKQSSDINNKDQQTEKPTYNEQVKIVPQTKILNNTKQQDNQTEDDGSPLSIEPMRPLLSGYCSTLSRPRNFGSLVQSDGNSDYCDISLVNGYLSEGEVLRNSSTMDITTNGYMSEGTSVLYAKRLQTIPSHLTNG